MPDSRFDPFSAPWNGVNSNEAAGNGQWGVNSNYITPSYMSPYRPQYQGSNGMAGGSNPGFWSSANYVMNPFRSGGDNYGGNYYPQTSPFYTSMGQKPLDAAMNVSQQVVLPTAMMYFAYKYLDKPATKFFGGMGTGFGTRLAMSMGAGASTASTVGKGFGLVGKGFGMMVPSYMAAQAVGSAADALVFDPYIAQSQMASSFRDNFSGVSFGAGIGNQVTGRGLSRGYASRLASRLNQAGAMDMTFSQQEYGQMADLIGRSGMMDQVSGKDLGPKMENIIKQVKVVMGLANSSDFKETIELMAQVNRSGVKLGDISSSLAQLTGFASGAGVSTQRFMNTTGAQGGFMAQSMGLTPFAGMMVAGQANASMASAYRSGLISPALMARMGGVEGATQSATAGTLGSSQSMLALMSAMNAAMGGKGTNDIYKIISQFGAMAAKDPIKAKALLEMEGPAASSNLAKKGITGVYDQMMNVINGNPLLKRSIANGRLPDTTAYAALTSPTIGQTRDQAMATILQMESMQDPNSANQVLAGIESSRKDAYLKYMRDTQQDMGWASHPYGYFTKKGRELLAYTSSNINAAQEGMAHASDSLERRIINARMQSRPGLSYKEYTTGVSPKSTTYLSVSEFAKVHPVLDYLDRGSIQGDISDLNFARDSSDPEIASAAQAAIESKDPGKRDRALSFLADKGLVSKNKYSGTSNLAVANRQAFFANKIPVTQTTTLGKAAYFSLGFGGIFKDAKNPKIKNLEGKGFEYLTTANSLRSLIEKTGVNEFSTGPNRAKRDELVKILKRYNPKITDGNLMGVLDTSMRYIAENGLLTLSGLGMDIQSSGKLNEVLQNSLSGDNSSVDKFLANMANMNGYDVKELASKNASNLNISDILTRQSTDLGFQKDSGPLKKMMDALKLDSSERQKIEDAFENNQSSAFQNINNATITVTGNLVVNNSPLQPTTRTPTITPTPTTKAAKNSNNYRAGTQGSQ